MTTFAAPSEGGGGIHAADLNGHLLICYPLSVEKDIPTTYGAKDAIRINVADLTTGEFHGDALWFGGYLIGGLKNSIGTPVLAVMGQGEAKPGQSPPWKLLDRSQDPASIEAATAWLNANPGRLSGQGLAATAPATPAPAPVATVPAASMV